jgi:hypothetical protein
VEKLGRNALNKNSTRRERDSPDEEPIAALLNKHRRKNGFIGKGSTPVTWRQTLLATVMAAILLVYGYIYVIFTEQSLTEMSLPRLFMGSIQSLLVVLVPFVVFAVFMKFVQTASEYAERFIKEQLGALWKCVMNANGTSDERARDPHRSYFGGERTSNDFSDTQKENEDSGNSEPIKDERHFGRVLGLEGKVSREDIRGAYISLAKQYHPDKVQHLGARLRELAEHEMKQLNEAYAYFTDKYGR